MIKRFRSWTQFGLNKKIIVMIKRIDYFCMGWGDWGGWGDTMFTTDRQRECGEQKNFIGFKQNWRIEMNLDVKNGSS